MSQENRNHYNFDDYYYIILKNLRYYDQSLNNMTKFPNFSHGYVFKVASLWSVAGSCYYGENKNLFFPWEETAAVPFLLSVLFWRTVVQLQKRLTSQPGPAPAGPPFDDHRSALRGLAASCLSASGLCRVETALVRKCRRPSSEPTVRQPETASPLNLEV